MNAACFATCDKIVVISSKALPKFPKIASYVETYARPVKSLLFFAVETPCSKYTFNDAVITGFANVTITNLNKRANIQMVTSTNAEVRTTLITSILSFFTTLKTFIKVKLTNNFYWQEEVKFLTQFGFSNPKKSQDTEDIQLSIKKNNPPMDVDEILRRAVNISRSAMFLCKLKLYFPMDLAKMLSKFIKDESAERGGRLYIESFIKDPDGEPVGVLGTKPEYIEHGEDDGIKLKNISPISFHTHTDAGMKRHGMYANWPSPKDMTALTFSYLNNIDVLVHFVLSHEGVWVIHLKPAFQKFLYKLKNSEAEASAKCQKLLLERIYSEFSLGNYLDLTTIPPEDREYNKRKFVHVSKNLRIYDVLSTNETMIDCGNYITENFYLFDLELIKWETFFFNKVIMSFSYMSDPKGNLPCNMSVDAPYQTSEYGPIDFSEDEYTTDIDDDNDDTPSSSSSDDDDDSSKESRRKNKKRSSMSDDEDDIKPSEISRNRRRRKKSLKAFSDEDVEIIKPSRKIKSLKSFSDGEVEIIRSIIPPPLISEEEELVIEPPKKVKSSRKSVADDDKVVIVRKAKSPIILSSEDDEDSDRSSRPPKRRSDDEVVIVRPPKRRSDDEVVIVRPPKRRSDDKVVIVRKAKSPIILSDDDEDSDRRASSRSSRRSDDEVVIVRKAKSPIILSDDDEDSDRRVSSRSSRRSDDEDSDRRTSSRSSRRSDDDVVIVRKTKSPIILSDDDEDSDRKTSSRSSRRSDDDGTDDELMKLKEDTEEEDDDFYKDSELYPLPSDDEDDNDRGSKSKKKKKKKKFVFIDDDLTEEDEDDS
jgi:hypothetical protein